MSCAGRDRKPQLVMIFIMRCGSEAARGGAWDSSWGAGQRFCRFMLYCYLSFSWLCQRGRPRRLVVVTQNNLMPCTRSLARPRERLMSARHQQLRRRHQTAAGGERTPRRTSEQFRKTRCPPVCECGGFLQLAVISSARTCGMKTWDGGGREAAADLAVALGSTLSVHGSNSAQTGTTNRGPTKPMTCPTSLIGRRCGEIY